MKYLILVGDGMADFPLDALDGRTPLEVAATPAMDRAVSRGFVGQYCPIPEAMPPGSAIGNLSLFGYDPHKTFTGRAPLEAASQGIALEDDDVAFRINLVTLDNGAMASFTADHITTEEARPLVEALGEALSELPLSVYPGVSYRHLLILPRQDVTPDDLVQTRCTPPHDISDQLVAPHLPNGPAAPLLLDLIECSQRALADHPVNRDRIAAGKQPATSIWPWGQGGRSQIQTYPERFGLSGAVISAVDLVKGIGICAGLEAIAVPGATGYLDTNYQGKVEAALGALEQGDFAYVHVEAPDEAAHEGRIDLKVQAIEDFDRQVVAPCLERLDAGPSLRILIAPDHVTSIASKTHAGGPVPFVVCGAGVVADASEEYTERAAAAAGLCLEAGHVLTPAVLRQTELTAASWNE